MDLAQVLIGVIGLGASIATFCLLRFPHVRRPRFRRYRAYSFGLSLLGAMIILTLCVLMMVVQGAR